MPARPGGLLFFNKLTYDLTSKEYVKSTLLNWENVLLGDIHKSTHEN